MARGPSTHNGRQTGEERRCGGCYHFSGIRQSKTHHRITDLGRRRTGALAMTNEPTWGPVALQNGLTRFQIWAPAETLLSLELEGKLLPMMRSQDGWHRVEVEAAVGSAYRFILSDGRRVADPASRQ